MALGHFALDSSSDLVVEVVTGYTESGKRVDPATSVFVMVDPTVCAVVGTVNDSALMTRSVIFVFAVASFVTN